MPKRIATVAVNDFKNCHRAIFKNINIVVMHPEDTGHHNYVSPWTADVHVPHVTQTEICIIGIVP